MQNQILNQSFSFLGLETLACEIYLELLQNPNHQNLTNLANKYSINRVRLYVILDSLLAKNIVTKQTKKWVACHPQKILALVKEQNAIIKSTELELEKVVQNLSLNIQDMDPGQKTISIITGVYNCVLEYYKLLNMPAGSTQYAYNIGQDFVDLFGNEFLQYAKKRTQNGINLKILCNTSDRSSIDNQIHDAQNLRTVKILKDKKYLQLPCWIAAGDTILFYQSDIPRIIKVVDQQLVDLQVMGFEEVWNQGTSL
jgi:predicted transcriptional regulator